MAPAADSFHSPRFVQCCSIARRSEVPRSNQVAVAARESRIVMAQLANVGEKGILVPISIHGFGSANLSVYTRSSCATNSSLHIAVGIHFYKPIMLDDLHLFETTHEHRPQP